ncbi:hypothetical protein HPO96_31365 [Kribbella sandramycini]|uniref:Uncharacterized protein n=1 Tax=Kribbella sandramycini TaxID=60450 RepID=A0A7Y4L5K3_9ACTN|nr:hypothetical protein [Kribbella sandramycini]MBB6567038.1 hypothetical protein [Kribbella sandramycini]NOL44759.1 hypothetical protein [Kribbella sandramycini]
MVSGPFDTGPSKPRGPFARFYTLPLAHERVWELLRHMQVSMRIVGTDLGAGHPNRTMMQQPRVDLHRSGVLTVAPGSLATPLYGEQEHRTLKELVAPNAAQRVGRRLRGPDVPSADQRDARRGALVGSLRAVADLAESAAYDNPFRPKHGVLSAKHGWTRDRQLAYSGMRTTLKSMEETIAESAAGVQPQYGGLQEAVAGAWTAAHYDKVLADLESRGHLPPGSTQDYALGWEAADPQQRRQILAQVHRNAPAGYAFAEAIAERTGMSAEQALHRMNNAPLQWTPDVAAGLLMSGSPQMRELAEQDPSEYAVAEGEVAELVRGEFENLSHVKNTGLTKIGGVDPVAQSANGGRRTATAALELIAQQEQGLEQPVKSADVAFDPRFGIAPPVGGIAPAAPPAVTAKTTSQTRDPGLGVG